MKQLEGKVAIVTGASSGIGAAAAVKLVREGAKVVLAARGAEKGQAVLKGIEEIGGVGAFVRTDVTNGAEVEALVAETLARFGRLDCAVNSAGIVGPTKTPVADIEEADWDAVMNTNLKAMWMCMKHQIPAMLKSGGGSIVNISSIYGYEPSEVGHAAYCTSKHGVIGLSKTAAIDYAKQGIRVNVVAPGFTRSGIVDPATADDARKATLEVLVARHSAMKRIGRAEETAEAIAWLCSDAASFVNGAVLPVDGGETSRIY